MLCPTCRNETDTASLFCRVCDAYSPDPLAGSKANVGVRLFAHFLDMAIALAIFLSIALVSCGLGAGISSAGASDLGGAMGFGSFFLAIAGYTVFLLFFLSQGKTPGKSLSGLRVADKRNGSLPGAGRMLLRETLGKFVSGLFLGLGYLWAIFDRDSQAWHDKIAGTVVLKTRPSSQLAPAADAASGDKLA